MQTTLLLLHSFTRWLVLVVLICSIYKAFIGYKKNKIFTQTDDFLRHSTATVSHIQLIIGIILYTKSPIVKTFWSHSDVSTRDFDITFFGIIHSTLMLISIVFLTITSAMAKRKSNDLDKFKTMFVGFSIALIIIFIAIPWSFSPLSNRPYLRTF